MQSPGYITQENIRGPSRTK